MGVGEYISVSSQRDTEQADIEVERREQEKGPEARARELEELISIYQDRGLDYDLAKQVRPAMRQGAGGGRGPLRECTRHAQGDTGVNTNTPILCLGSCCPPKVCATGLQPFCVTEAV